MEEVSDIPKETLDQWQSLAGKLIYIINPWRKLQKEEGDIATAQDGTEEISYSFNFPIADHTYYNNLRAVLDIPVKTASSPPLRRRRLTMTMIIFSVGQPGNYVKTTWSWLLLFTNM